MNTHIIPMNAGGGPGGDPGIVNIMAVIIAIMKTINSKNNPP